MHDEVAMRIADGRAHVAGWIDIATRDSSIATRLRSVELVPLQPYLIRKGETGIGAVP